MRETMSKTNSLISVLFLLSLSMLAANNAVAEEYHEGFEYFSLSTPQKTVAEKGTIEVVELFWYGCQHCYRFEPVLSKWLKAGPKNVTFVRVPAIFPGWPGAEVHARAYYTAVALKVVNKVHQPLFDKIQKIKPKVITQAQIKAIFVKQGVKADDFDKTYMSASVQKMIDGAKVLAKGYEASSVPMMIVGGKYKADAGLVDGSFEKLLVLVEYLVKKEMGTTK